MPKTDPRRKLIAFADHSAELPVSDLFKHINHVFNNRLSLAREQRGIIRHSGEAGQIAENIVREILTDTLPIRFGVTKGKITNHEGTMTRHLDVIIYDAFNFPALFIDDNRNQILPVESVYAVIEVKSVLSKSVLVEAFEELHSVAMMNSGSVRSHNRKVDYYPPILGVLALSDNRTLDTIHQNFVELNERYPQEFSGSCYGSLSPGSKDMTGEKYMIHDVTVVGKGSVYHMLDGSTAIGRWGEATIGMFISSLLATLDQIKLSAYSPYSYLSWLHAGAREIYRSPKGP